VAEVSTSPWARPIAVAPERDSETGLWTKHRLCINYRRINEVLGISQTDFDMVMNEVFTGLKEQFMNNIINDICVYSKSFDEHLEHLTQIFKRCKTTSSGSRQGALVKKTTLSFVD
jgi:hypothetical protein